MVFLLLLFISHRYTFEIQVKSFKVYICVDEVLACAWAPSLYNVEKQQH